MIMEWNGELISLPRSLAKPSYPYAEINHHEVFDTTKIVTEVGYQDIVPADVALKRTIDWCLSNRQYINDNEKNLGDKFDYATEDRIIAEYREFSKKVNDIPFVYERPFHAYAHPKKPMGSNRG